MQRQTAVQKITHPTKLDITIRHDLRGDKPVYDKWGQEGHQSGFSFYTHYHPKSNQEVFANFQDMYMRCGPDTEFGYKEITGRETEITASGVINGKKVADQVFYSLVDYARFLKKHDVDVICFAANNQERLEKKIAKKKPVESNLTDLHVRGFMNGNKLSDNEVHSTKELLSVLNRRNKGAKFALVKEDEVVMTKDQVSSLQEVAIKAQLFDLMVEAKRRQDEQEAARAQSSVRVVDVTDGDTDEMMVAAPRM